MANHQSAKKRARQSVKRYELNRYKNQGMKLAVKALRNTTDKAQAEEMLPSVFSKIDRAAKSNIIHDNKAANMKRKLAKYVNTL
jgi:small subunit ribosomal protein S20